MPDKACDRCGAGKLARVSIHESEELCAFCYEQAPSPAPKGVMGRVWCVAATMVNFLEGRLGVIVRRAVDEVLEERGW